MGELIALQKELLDVSRRKSDRLKNTLENRIGLIGEEIFGQQKAIEFIAKMYHQWPDNWPIFLENLGIESHLEIKEIESRCSCRSFLNRDNRLSVAIDILNEKHVYLTWKLVLESLLHCEDWEIIDSLLKSNILKDVEDNVGINKNGNSRCKLPVENAVISNNDSFCSTDCSIGSTETVSSVDIAGCVISFLENVEIENRDRECNILLTYAVADRIVAMEVKDLLQSNEKPHIKVWTISELTQYCCQDSLATCVTKLYRKVDFIVPILSKQYIQLIEGNDMDNNYVKLIFTNYTAEYNFDGCMNKRIRPLRLKTVTEKDLHNIEVCLHRPYLWSSKFEHFKANLLYSFKQKMKEKPLTK